MKCVAQGKMQFFPEAGVVGPCGHRLAGPEAIPHPCDSPKGHCLLPRAGWYKVHAWPQVN